MRRLKYLLCFASLGGFLCCATVGCAQGTAAPPSRGALQSAGPASAIGRSPTPDAALLGERAKAATMSPVALASLKLDPAEVDQAGVRFSIEACGTNIAGSGEPTASYQRIWPSDTGGVNQVVRAHGYTAGAAMVDQARKLGSACKPYTENQHRWESFGEVPLPALTGIDAVYAYCERWKTTSGDGVWRCRGFLGRGVSPDHGGLVTTIISQTAYGRARAVNLMTDAVTIAAPVFAAA